MPRSDSGAWPPAFPILPLSGNIPLRRDSHARRNRPWPGTTALTANRLRTRIYLDNTADGDYSAVRLASFCENASGTSHLIVSIKRGAAL